MGLRTNSLSRLISRAVSASHSIATNKSKCGTRSNSSNTTSIDLWQLRQTSCLMNQFNVCKAMRLIHRPDEEERARLMEMYKPALLKKRAVFYSSNKGKIMDLKK